MVSQSIVCLDPHTCMYMCTGQVATSLVREFLNFFDLDYTRSVFDPETNAVSFVFWQTLLVLCMLPQSNLLTCVLF